MDAWFSLAALESWSQGLSNGTVYLLLFSFALLENILPPLPGDTVVVYGGYLVGMDRLALGATVATVTAGSWSGFMLYFMLGRWMGRSRVHKWLGRIIPPQALTRGEAWVRRYGLWAVLVNRWLTGARSVISLAAGFAGMGWPRVGAMALISAVLWNAMLVWAGQEIGAEWETVVGLLVVYRRVVLVLLAAAVVAGVAWMLLRRRRSTAE